MATTETTPPALSFVVLYVADMERASTYFTETLGCTKDAAQSGPTFHYLKSSTGGIDFGLQLSEPETLPAGSVELGFSAPHLEELRAAVTSKGAEATPIEVKPFATIFTTHAPDGQLLTMMKLPAPRLVE